MNLLIFSKDYYFNPFNSHCLNNEMLYKLKKLNADIYIIVQDHPCNYYETTLRNGDETKIVRVQQYPFASDFYNMKSNSQNNYYADNVRAQEGGMLLAKQGCSFDYIIIDNIGYALAAQSYAEIYKIPVIYLKYADQDLKENLIRTIEEWLLVFCDYIIDEENIDVNCDNKQISDQAINIFNLFKDYIADSNSNDGE